MTMTRKQRNSDDNTWTNNSTSSIRTWCIKHCATSSLPLFGTRTYGRRCCNKRPTTRSSPPRTDDVDTDFDQFERNLETSVFEYETLGHVTDWRTA